ncbi:hypothetical protein E5P78_02960 [Helicobacter pylori]|uniref:hypothetical protein n=1 Tax=Helicobacter pylori TaxID=210 RepID=UPI003465242E|nr:hypothetical protein E5P78_02960 [Helicobacter pylori]WQX50053.1 hypothetical protein E5P58_02965 [Helicobacter pylori]
MGLERFLKSFDAIRAYLLVTLLARFNKYFIQSLGFVYFLGLERFLKSFDAIRAYLLVTLLARFNKY